MRVQVLYFEGCPNHKPAVDLARQVAAELNLAIQVEEVEVSRGDDVTAARFLGSPTIQVEGLDVEPAARLRTDYGFSCRMYDGRGVPSRETMAQSLAEAVNGAGTRPGLWAAVSYPERQARVHLDRNVLLTDDPLVETVEALGYSVPDGSIGNIAHDLESQP